MKMSSAKMVDIFSRPQCVKHNNTQVMSSMHISRDAQCNKYLAKWHLQGNMKTNSVRHEILDTIFLYNLLIWILHLIAPIGAND